MSAPQQPLRILILAGPIGADKTTFAREYLPCEADCLQFVNADLIAEGLSPFAPEKAAIAAGKLMLQEIARLSTARQSFAFETTLSGRRYARVIPQWQAAGYRVELHFLQPADADIAVARVKRRVLQGGHSIPEPVSAVATRPVGPTLSRCTRHSSMIGWSTTIPAHPRC